MTATIDPIGFGETRVTKKKRYFVVVFVLIVAGAAGGIYLWQTRLDHESRHELVLYGNVDIRQVDLAFNARERIVSMLVEEGDQVERGQLVAVLRKERLEAATKAMEAQVGAQAQQLARLKAGSRPEEIRQAQAEYDAAKADANNAAITNRRMQALVAEDATPIQNADDARARAQITAAKVRSAKETLDLAIAGPRKEDIAAAKATLEAYQAQLALARQELADANLYAPSTGIVQNRILEPGDMASPATPVYTLALSDPLWVRAYIPEKDLGKIHQGMTAQVTTDSYPGKIYDAWIGFISPTAQFTPKSVETPDLRSRLVYQVRVYVHNPDNELRLGMPATVTIPLAAENGTGQ